MLIAITGIDGSGKSTQVKLLKKFLENKKYSVFVSKAYGEREKFFLGDFFKYLEDMAITYVFQGLHRQQYIEAMKALEKNKIVIADRWDETYLAFHNRFGALAKNKRLREELNKSAFGGVIPDITFYIDIKPKDARLRLKSRVKDFLSAGSNKYYEEIRQSTIKALKGRPVVFIDGLKPIAEIHDVIKSEVKKYLKI